MDKKVVSNNRKAFHDFTIFEKYEAGIVLTGTEIKSIRNGAIQLKDSFCRIDNGEAFMYNCHISPYDKGNIFNHEPERIRKLLLTKREILKISDKVKQEKYTIIPLEIYLKGGYAKVELGLAKGKKIYDKREDKAKKDQQREIDRASKIRY